MLQSLEARLLKSNFFEAKKFISNIVGLDSGERTILDENLPDLFLNNRFYGAYNFGFNDLEVAPKAVDDYLAIGEETGHWIWFMLNPEARAYFLNPENMTPSNYKNLIRAFNQAEYFARYAALLYANFKGQRNVNHVWSHVDTDSVILTTDPVLLEMHLYGYRKAERAYNSKGRSGFNKRLLYSFDLPQMEISDRPQIHQLAA